jgi:serine/threonine protein kinase
MSEKSGSSITGTTIGGAYQITSHLRPSRMGDAWLARRLSDHTQVAIKLLDPALFNEPEAIVRFEREARVIGKLRHPCIMGLLDHGKTTDGIPYLVTEHVNGEVLSDVIEEAGKLAPERVGRIAARVALALGAAHQQGIIHRDLQPANILVTQTGGEPDGVRVLEFGLARIVASESEESGEDLTAVGVRIGSPAYMAPEYIEEYNLDSRADLYALGIVMYEMLVGQPPFTGRPYKILNMHVSEPAPPPSKAVPGIPPFLDALVLELLEKQADKRPASAQVVVDRLETGFGRSFTPSAPTVKRNPTPSPKSGITRATGQLSMPRDPILDQFIQSHVYGVQRAVRVAQPDRGKCLFVGDVARWSIVGDAGVKPGWLLELPDEPTVGLRNPEFWREYVERRHYRFTAPDGSEQVDITATSIEPGASFVRTIEHIRERFDPTDPDPSALYELWIQGAWEELEKIARKAMTGSRGGLNSGIFTRLLGGEQKRRFEDHPALLFLGAALVETGKEREGFEAVAEFQANHAMKWPVRYRAVAAFYMGLRALRANKDQLALDRWQAALDLEPLERILNGIEQLTGERPNTAPWLAQKFPEYSIEYLRQEVRLSRTLAALDGSQLLAICMLGGFRGSVEYNEFMSRYMTYSAFFKGFLPELHVITTQTDRESDKGEFYAAEDQAISAGVRMFVLHDALAWVQRQVKVTRIPTVFLVNKWGYVAHEGVMNAPSLWDALRRTATMRLRTVGAAV